MMEMIKLPPLDEVRGRKVQNKFAGMPMAGAHLGRLEQLAVQYASMTAKSLPRKLKPHMLLMCGDHGIAKYGISAFPQEVTKQMMQGYQRGTAGAMVLARHAGAEVTVCDMGTAFDQSDLPMVKQLKVAWGTDDFTQGPAMSREQAELAVERGMQVANDCIDKGCNLLVTAEMGIGNTTASAAIASAFLGLEPLETVGRGSGINDARLKIKREVVSQGLEINKPVQGDGWDVLQKLGGYDHAGLVGMILAGAQRRVPTMLDGVNATAAALVAYGICPQSRDYLFCSHFSSDLSHKRMLEFLGLEPLVDAGLRLGEGTGAALAIPVLQLALDLYNKLGKGK